MAVGRLRAEPDAPTRTLLASLAVYSAISVVPDLDVISGAFDLRHPHPFSHRGATHSPAAAALVAVAAAAVAHVRNRSAVGVGLAVFLVVVSHGVIDMLGQGGKGVAVLWPLSDARFHAPVRVLPSVPVEQRFSTTAGLEVAAVHLLLCSPLLLYALWPRRSFVSLR
jgi:inner membrane protein